MTRYSQGHVFFANEHPVTMCNWNPAWLKPQLLMASRSCLMNAATIGRAEWHDWT
jgi:hypothetical protein